MGNDKSAGSALLTVSGKGHELSFELEQGFTDGYENRLLVPAETEQMTSNPKGYNWQGGKFKPMQVEINLAVGVQNAISTPEELQEIVLKFFMMALPNDIKNTVQDPVTIRIGNWWTRVGYMMDLSVKWDKPYDIDTGMPFLATVTFNFVADFYNLDRDFTKERNPTAANFTFDFTGKS